MSDATAIPEEVIADLQAGRQVERNFEMLFRAFHRNVSGYFERHGVDREQSRDLTQEVFLVVLSNIGSLRSTAGFRSWLFGIARNKLLHYYEHHKQARLTREPMDGEAGDAIADPGPSGLEQALDRERRMKLRIALEELPQQMRACVKLSIVEDLEYAEIARRLGVSVNTVKVHIHRARRALTSRLGQAFGADPG